MRMEHNNETNSQKYASRCENLMTPAHVADKESCLPMAPPDDSVWWLNIGDSLMGIICPSGGGEFLSVIATIKRTLQRKSQQK